jgi:hypothetical protein
VGWWPFNGNANDESGNGNDGVVISAILAEDRFGLANKAFSLQNDVDGKIIVQDSPHFDFDSSFSVSIWAKFQQPWSYQFESIIQKGVYPIETGWFIGLDQNDQGNGVGNYNAGAGLYGNSGNFVGIGNAAQICCLPYNEINSWQHYILTYDNEVIKLFINGELISLLQLPDFPFNNTADIEIGGAANPGSTAVERLLDDIAIFNRALTEQEIQNLYTGTTPPPCVSLPSNLQQGLVGYWPFCGNANDESGNGNDGVVNGATLTEDRFGYAGSAYYFNGGANNNADNIQMNNPLDNTQGFSINYWMISNNTSDPSWHIMISDFNDYNLELTTYNDSIRLMNFIGSLGYSIVTLSGSIDTVAESVHNYCWTYDGNNLSLYIDGSLNETINFDGIAIPNSGSIVLGKHFFFNDFQNVAYEGSLDDIGIWNRALTPEEVQELYTLDACTFTVYDTLTVYETVYDTVYTYETIYDTVTTYITVTDTLLIDITFTGFEGQPSWLNTVTVFPNPASDHITIDYGNFALMAGYNTIITDAAGATVYSSSVNSQQVEIDINAWGATGVYYMMIYDSNGELVAVRHIVLE